MASANAVVKPARWGGLRVSREEMERLLSDASHDTKAMTLLVHHLTPIVRKIAVSCARHLDASYADDLTQEGLLKLVCAIDRLQRVGPSIEYIAQVARHAMLDALPKLCHTVHVASDRRLMKRYRKADEEHFKRCGQSLSYEAAVQILRLKPAQAKTLKGLLQFNVLASLDEPSRVDHGRKGTAPLRDLLPDKRICDPADIHEERCFMLCVEETMSAAKLSSLERQVIRLRVERFPEPYHFSEITERLELSAKSHAFQLAARGRAKIERWMRTSGGSLRLSM